MELKVIGKRLFTERIDKTITEGEYNADVIGITLDRYHDGTDLSGYSFRMTAYTEDGEAMAEQLLSKDPAGEKTIRLVWTVTPPFAAESGLLTLTLAGVAPDNSAQIKFTSSPVRINADGRAEFIPEKTVAEQYLNQIQLEVQKAADAAERAEEAASKPAAIAAATEEKIGGVLSGGDISVAEDGSVTVNSVGGKMLEADVPADAKFTDTVYTLPKASETVLGGVKADGKTVAVDANGVISAVGGSGGDGGSGYVLPAATNSSLGGVIVDGTTITADENGVISVIGGSGDGVDYVLPTATENVLGGVKVDGTTISANSGVISVADNSHSHSIENITGLQAALDSIPESVPANGGNADTVGGFTVGANVPADAKFTDTVYVLPEATSSVLGGVMTDGSTISANGGVISVADNSHGHTVANVTGLQTILDGKANISAIPTSLPANGGNASTVNGFTVNASVPAGAKFTDTVYSLPKATTSTLGGVKVDGTTITANASGIISALASGSGITIDKIYEANDYWNSSKIDYYYVKLPYAYTYWDYIFVSHLYTETSMPWFGYSGCALINTQHIITASRDPSTFQATKSAIQYITSERGGMNKAYVQFPNTTHIRVQGAEQIIIWGIKMSARTMLGTYVSSATA